jgi:argininosuccinate synthase
MPKYAELVYWGFWFWLEREILQAAIDAVRDSSAARCGSSATRAEEGAVAYYHFNAAGFIRLNALRPRTLGQRRRKLGCRGQSANLHPG